MEHGGEQGDALWVACTHGDVIKSVIADAYGMHLDSFQRVNADPASVSVIRYTQLRPFVVHVNHTGARLSAALRAAPAPKAEPKAESGDAVVGGYFRRLQRVVRGGLATGRLAECRSCRERQDEQSVSYRG